VQFGVWLVGNNQLQLKSEGKRFYIYICTNTLTEYISGIYLDDWSTKCEI